MLNTAVIAALQGVAKTLHEQARIHKRLELHHRRQAGKLQRQLKRVADVCDAHGVELHLTDTDDTDL